MTSEIILLRQLECPLKSFLIIDDVLLIGAQYHMAHQSRVILLMRQLECPLKSFLISGEVGGTTPRVIASEVVLWSGNGASGSPETSTDQSTTSEAITLGIVPPTPPITAGSTTTQTSSTADRNVHTIAI